MDRLLYPCVPGTKNREFVDKKLFFTVGDFGLEDEDGQGKEDIYMWTTSVPYEVCKEDFPLQKNYERSDCLIGIMKISKNRGSPGCKLHVISQRDGHLGSKFVYTTVAWVAAKRLPKWYDEFLEFMEK